MNTKIVDGFVWLLVTEKAKEIYSSGTFDLYVLHNDNSESLVESYAQINDAQECGLEIGIEVAEFENLVRQIVNLPFEQSTDEGEQVQEALEFEDNGETQRILFGVESPDFWFSVKRYDIHYCEDYNEICVYLQNEMDEAFPPFKLIYKRPIKN